MAAAAPTLNKSGQRNMTSLKEALAQLPTTTVEVSGISARPQPTLERITPGQAALIPVTQTPDGMQYMCDCCSGSDACCHPCDPGL
jgi:hypothetical protein